MRETKEWMLSYSCFNHAGRWLWVPAFAGTTTTKEWPNNLRSHPLRHHHVVHVHVGGETPAVGERAVDHAGLLGDGELVGLQVALELVGGDEFVPLMGAARQPAQDVFGADDGERKALPVAVQGRDHHDSAGLQHRGAAVEEHADIADMFDHFHRQHDVEALAHVHLLLSLIHI